MTKRRPLTAGLSSSPNVDAFAEKNFVLGKESNSGQLSTNPVSPIGPLVPLSTRQRPEIANALRRASLERKLNSTPSNSVQDIVEEALTPWLRDQGYLR